MPLDAPGGDGFLNRALTLVSRTEGSFARRACLPFGVAAVVLGAQAGVTTTTFVPSRYRTRAPPPRQYGAA